tara:strand:- start:371 stop:1147 length:777 start_codon:yes stop_codon:yes gene_type:complete
MKWSITSSIQFKRCPRIIYYKKVNYMKKVNIKKSISPSRYNIVGNVVHDTFERLYKTQINNIVGDFRIGRDEIKKEIRKCLESYDWNNDNDIEKDLVFGKSFDNVKKGKQILEKNFRGSEIISVEKEIDWEINNVPIQGKIDLIVKDKNGNHWILDWKTQYEMTSTIGDPQLVIYSEWAKSNLTTNLVKLAHIYTNLGEWGPNYTSHEITEKLFKEISDDYEYWRRYNKEVDYVTKPHNWNCRVCKYINQCPDSRIDD